MMKIAVLGTGSMGTTLINRVRGSYGRDVSIAAYDKNSDALSSIKEMATIEEPSAWFAPDSIPDAVIIAVQPFDIASALEPILRLVDNGSLIKPLWISIVAGKSSAFFKAMLPPGVRVCRVMPNTPALIGEAVSAYALSENACAADAGIVEMIFRACGKTVPVPEQCMHAVTGLSGSGPAYVFLFLEALIEAGIMAGLPQGIAREFAVQTVIGAAKMAAAFGEESLSDLKLRVLSPAGTTASGLMALERHSFKDAIIKAVVAATKRSEQLGK